MTALRIARAVHVTVHVETDIVALFTTFDHEDVRAYFALFERVRLGDVAPDWWMESNGFTYDDLIPLWQRPMIYLADLRLDVEVAEASKAVGRHVRTGIADPTFEGPWVIDPARTTGPRWNEADYRALCLAVPWLGESEDSVVSREDLARLPGPHDPALPL